MFGLYSRLQADPKVKIEGWPASWRPPGADRRLSRWSKVNSRIWLTPYRQHYKIVLGIIIIINCHTAMRMTWRDDILPNYRRRRSIPVVCRRSRTEGRRPEDAGSSCHGRTTTAGDVEDHHPCPPSPKTVRSRFSSRLLAPIYCEAHAMANPDISKWAEDH